MVHHVKIDIRSKVNVLPINTFKRIDRQFKVRNTRVILESFGGTKFKPVGVVNLHCVSQNMESYLNFYLVDFQSSPLLGLIGSSDQSVKYEFVKTNNDVFCGLGSFPKDHSICLAVNVSRFQHSTRRVANPLKKELDRLQKAGVIVKVTDPDPDGCISNIAYYSVFDFNEGFSQLKLTQEFTSLLCFPHHLAFFSYRRMPYGLTPVPDEFQEEVDTTFVGVKFNPDKVQYKLSQVKYLVHVFSEKGTEIDPDSQDLVRN
ncbi:hypothetical protein PR048_020126 [Dryococelus australis]|uniref:Uncharacterized protein n=1 Tax=Dryococelus australis TaxID=614101 RepID=A0ABQ9H5T3_9NEOP|nr:hypothetical protein PR048_020126 [Dryococelus australis]